MHGRRDEDSLAQLCGLLENRMGNKISRLFIQKDILPFPGSDMKLPSAHHIVEPIRINACGIHNAACFINSCGGGNAITVRRFFNVLCFRIKMELHAVLKGIFRKSDCHLKGTDNPACGGIQHGCHLRRQIRLQLMYFLSGNDTHIGNAVGFGALPEYLKPGQILFIKTENQGAISFKWKIQFFGERIHHAVSRHVHSGLQRAGNRIIPRMDNGAVGLGGTAAHILLPLQDSQLQLVT